MLFENKLQISGDCQSTQCQNSFRRRVSLANEFLLDITDNTYNLGGLANNEKKFTRPMHQTSLKRKLVSRAVRIKVWRFWLSAAGISTCVLLLLSLAAALHSATSAFAEYILSSKADLWVAPSGTDNLVRTSSFLPLDYQEKLQRMPGIRQVDPITVGFATIKTVKAESLHERGLTFLSVGYKSPNGMGGPPKLVSGSASLKFGEVALDRAGAMRLKINVGDKVSMGGHSVSVVGLTDGTNLAITHMAFGDYGTTSIVGGYLDQASFLLVRAVDGTDISALANSIRKNVPGTNVIKQRDFIENCTKEAVYEFIPVFVLVNVFGLASAAALVALLVHGLVEEKHAELATLLALGVPLRQLWFAVCWQGLRLALTGAILGVACTYILGRLLDKFYPVFPVNFGIVDVMGIFSLFALAGILASSLPLLRLRNLDPMEAFRP